MSYTRKPACVNRVIFGAFSVLAWTQGAVTSLITTWGVHRKISVKMIIKCSLYCIAWNVVLKVSLHTNNEGNGNINLISPILIMPSFFINISLSLQLTPATLGCLHQLISYLGEASDYQNAMLFYSSMVSGPSFSEIAAFAPTIKILIQQSIQLQIVWWSSDINKYSQYNTAHVGQT